MFAIIQGGHALCDHCKGTIEPIGQLKSASWGSPEIWEYQCVRCESLYFSEVNPNDVSLVPELE